MALLTDSRDVHVLEEKTLNAWAPLRRTLCDGWVLGFSEGFTRRANSVNVLYPGRRGVQEKVALCESAYAARGLRPVFKITPLALEQDLDIALPADEYQREAETLVLSAPMDRLPAAAAGIDARRTLDADWMMTYADLKGMSARDTTMTEAILRQASGQARFVTLHVAGKAVAGGFCIIEGEHLGLFGIVTDPAHRRKGHASGLVTTLLNLGWREGARTAYLQVEQSNPGAIGLYEKFGFQESYRYWYRVGVPRPARPPRGQ